MIDGRMAGRVLIFSVDPEVRWLGIRTLRGLGLTVEHSDTWEKALAFLGGEPFDLVLFGPDHFALPKVEKVVQHLKREQPQVVPIFVVAQKTEHYIPLLRQYAEVRHVVARQHGTAAHEIMVLARKLLSREVLGLGHYLAPDVVVRELMVTESAQKYGYIEEVLGFARMLTGDQATLTTVETIVDEMVMNVLYNAPHESGRPRYMHLARSEPIKLTAEEAGTLRFACDGERIYLAASDPFGKLTADTILAHIEARLAGGSEQITESGGGGFGLFTIFQNASSMVLNLVPGRCSELIATLDLRAPLHETKRQAKSLHFFDGK
jgi:hypothetical protein